MIIGSIAEKLEKTGFCPSRVHDGGEVAARSYLAGIKPPGRFGRLGGIAGTQNAQTGGQPIGSISEPPEILGKLIGGALVGTFLGVWLSYGFLGPIAAKAQAVVRGRDYVTPDDVKEIAPAALRHRITLVPEVEIEGRTPDDCLRDLLIRVEVPR